MSKAAALKAELEAATQESWDLDQQINTLRERQAAVNSRRKLLEVDFQREDALEAQARVAAGQQQP